MQSSQLAVKQYSLLNEDREASGVCASVYLRVFASVVPSKQTFNDSERVTPSQPDPQQFFACLFVLF